MTAAIASIIVPNSYKLVSNPNPTRRYKWIGTKANRRQLLDVLNRRLAQSEYLGGAEYSIADIAVFPWYGGLVKGWAYGAAEFLSVSEYSHVQRWTDAILTRPAVRRSDGESHLWRAFGAATRTS